MASQDSTHQPVESGSKSGLTETELERREILHVRAASTAGSLHFTYKRNYVAAEWVGRFGWLLDVFTGIVGVVLLYVLTRQGNPNFPIFSALSYLSPADLTIILLVGSLLSAFYGPKLRSRDYYNAGQELQELYDDVIDYIEIDLNDETMELKELEDKYREVNRKRHHLNQSTPQLGGHWYRAIKWKQKYKRWVPWESFSEWDAPEFNARDKS